MPEFVTPMQMRQKDILQKFHWLDERFNFVSKDQLGEKKLFNDKISMKFNNIFINKLLIHYIIILLLLFK